MTNLYKILGLSGNANEEDIRKSYKKLVRKYHPDKNDGNDTKFKKIQKAYNILSNPEKKKNIMICLEVRIRQIMRRILTMLI